MVSLSLSICSVPACLSWGLTNIFKCWVFSSENQNKTSSSEITLFSQKLVPLLCVTLLLLNWIDQSSEFWYFNSSIFFTFPSLSIQPFVNSHSFWSLLQISIISNTSGPSNPFYLGYQNDLLIWLFLQSCLHTYFQSNPLILSALYALKG